MRPDPDQEPPARAPRPWEQHVGEVLPVGRDLVAAMAEVLFKVGPAEYGQ